MINAIPVLGWILDVFFKASLAIPFWFFWTKMEVGQKFFNFLPDAYHVLGFWETVHLFICAGILVSFSPFRSHISQSQTNSPKQEK